VVEGTSQNLIAVGAFALLALPNFNAKPAPIPYQPSSVILPVKVDMTYSVSRNGAKSELISLVRPLSSCVARCRLRPRRENATSHHVAILYCLRVLANLRPLNVISGLTTGFSFYRFTSQPLLGSLPWIRRVD